MKTIFPLIIALCFGATIGQAQGVNIAVIDMELALRQYYRTSEEVDKINALGNEKIRNIDERKAVYEQMTSDINRLDREARAGELSEERKRAAYAKLQEMARARNAKANEIGDAERKANRELADARRKMESMLISEIKAVVESVVAQRGYDLVFDKSFLPKASKSILYTSPKVSDLTNEVISRLNSRAR